MKHYSLRFIDSARFMNVLLNSFDNTLSNKTFNAKCKHCKKLEECKKCKKRQDDSVESCDRYKKRKKMFSYCICYVMKFMKIVNVILNT